jgi:hypothetical protein
MYCGECGARGEGKFCTQCGAKLVAGGGGPPAVIDWDNEVRYETILAFPGVRDTIAAAAKNAKKRVSGEQFLAVAEAITPVPLEKLAGILQPVYSSMGVNTGKLATTRVDAPVARVVVRAMCALAEEGEPVVGVVQHDDGCEIEATLPSDFWALAGTLTVAVRREGPHARVEAATKIPGQLYDWGKSAKRLARLAEQLSRAAA